MQLNLIWIFVMRDGDEPDLEVHQVGGEALTSDLMTAYPFVQTDSSLRQTRESKPVTHISHHYMSTLQTGSVCAKQQTKLSIYS